jgi:DNA modification methylase
MAVTDQLLTDRYAIYNADCVELMQALPADSVHLTVYSPPFGGLYCYSSNERDLSNCADYDEFFVHYGHVIREKYRVTMPGRMSAVHVADVPSGNSGGDHLIDFSGDVIRAHQKAGWIYVARYSVWKEPLGVRNRTMRKDLAHKSVVDDSSRCSCASADYLLIFRKRGENPIPITHPTGLMEYAGERVIPKELMGYRGHKGNQIENRYSHWIWRQYASAFWDDIRIGRVLPFQASRDEEDEKHVHPLQLDVIDRAIVLWSNEGETVLTPFMGVGSEVYAAVQNGRRGVGVELKPSYFKQAVKNVATAGDGPQPDQVPMFAVEKGPQKVGEMRPDTSPQRDRYARTRITEGDSMDDPE